MKHSILIILALLAGCASNSNQERPKTISVPVSVGCVSGERPSLVVPLADQHKDWHDKTIKQKAELIGAQSLRHKSYGEALNASTGACE